MVRQALRVLIGIFIAEALFSQAFGRIVPVVWSREGQQFSGGNKALVIDTGDEFAIVCPNVQDSNGRLPYDMMFENVWLVGSQGYRECDASEGKLLLKCKDPEQIKQVILKDLYTQLGKTYYLISTSNGHLSSLDNTKGGHCDTQNLKLTVYVQWMRAIYWTICQSHWNDKGIINCGREEQTARATNRESY